jgi:hypothetical protein
MMIHDHPTGNAGSLARALALVHTGKRGLDQRPCFFMNWILSFLAPPTVHVSFSGKFFCETVKILAGINARYFDR